MSIHPQPPRTPPVGRLDEKCRFRILALAAAIAAKRGMVLFALAAFAATRVYGPLAI
jgi:hypothetical protein